MPTKPIASAERTGTDRAETSHSGANAEFVQSLARGLAVIRAFDSGHPSLTLSEVAKRADMSRAAARRFLHTLVELGYMYSDGRVFGLRPSVLDLGYAYLSSLTLPEVAEPHLEALAAKMHESASVSVLDGDEIVYVARVPTSRIMAVNISIGTRFPAHATSMGKVLLAGLPDLGRVVRSLRLDRFTDYTITEPDALEVELGRVRERGWAMADQELELGLRSLAAPIRDTDGQVVAGVNMSMHASRVSATEAQRELLPALLETAARIEADVHASRTRSQGT